MNKRQALGTEQNVVVIVAMMVLRRDRSGWRLDVAAPSTKSSKLGNGHSLHFSGTNCATDISVYRYSTSYPVVYIYE
jgi:hypothetical protein